MNLEEKLELKKLELTVKKAQTAKDELEMKILEREIDIERMRNHIELQEKVIIEALEKLNK